MTDDQLNAARALKAKEKALDETLEHFAQERNFYDLPQEMYERHQAETKAWLESQLAAVRREFEAL